MRKVALTPAMIRKIRRPFTRKEFAGMLHVTKQAIYYWEHGTQRPQGPTRCLLGLLRGSMRARIVRWLVRNA